MPASRLDDVAPRTPRQLLEDAIGYVLLLLLAAVVGTMFGVWLGFDPSQLSARAYVEQQQNAIRALNTLLPVLGAVCIALTLVLAFRTHVTNLRYLLLAAAACLIAAALITRFGNQPINALVLHWTAETPPEDWQTWRDRWWWLHEIRTLAGVVAYALTLLAVLRRRSSKQTD
ncbi:MAG: DUF1772 domain-containing protein [Burkholderiaceae bacterium]|nr:DUF1772 domain-containing protein [Burkholderiaceae bacterium]